MCITEKDVFLDVHQPWDPNGYFLCLGGGDRPKLIFGTPVVSVSKLVQHLVLDTSPVGECMCLFRDKFQGRLQDVRKIFISYRQMKKECQVYGLFTERKAVEDEVLADTTEANRFCPFPTVFFLRL